MDIYKILNDAIYCDDFLQCARNLLAFSEAALSVKNRATLVKVFYERLQEHGLLKYAFDDVMGEHNKRYFICDGKSAIGAHMAIAIPHQETPVKSLKKIHSFAEGLLRDFTSPVGTHIKKDSLSEIMEYLDEKYDFSSKVFSDKKAIFSILDVSNRKYNSHCLIFTGEGKVIQHFFLYCMNEEGKTSTTPEAVLFHELSHAIHARLAGNTESVPKAFLDILQELCMPRIDILTAEAQSEVFADVLSVGLMYDGPFAEYDPFSYMHPDDKKVFKKMVEVILSHLRGAEK